MAPSEITDNSVPVATDSTAQDKADVPLELRPESRDKAEDSDAEAVGNGADEDVDTSEDELSPTQQHLADLPPGQGNKFRSYRLEEASQMQSFVSTDDDFQGSEGLADLAHKVEQLQNGVRDEFEHRDRGMRILQSRIDDASDRAGKLSDNLDKERNARVSLFEKRARDKKKIKALQQELAAEKAARQAMEKRLDKLESALSETRLKRDRDDDGDPSDEHRSEKRAKSR